MTSIYRALASSTTPNAISKGVSKPRVTLDSYHSNLSLRDNHVRVFSSLGQHNFSAYTASLLHLHRNFGYLHGSLIPTQKFQITPRVSYTHTEISNFSTGLLHLHRNLGHLPGSLTPTQKFGISPRVSYTYTKIQDISLGLLHPYRNSGSLPGSLTPKQKFGISPRVSYTHTEISGSLPGSLTPTQDLSDTTTGLLHPNSRLLTLGD